MLRSVKAVRVVSSQHLQAVSISELVCDDLFILYVCCDSEHTFLPVGSKDTLPITDWCIFFIL